MPHLIIKGVAPSSMVRVTDLDNGHVYHLGFMAISGVMVVDIQREATVEVTYTRIHEVPGVPDTVTTTSTLHVGMGGSEYVVDFMDWKAPAPSPVLRVPTGHRAIMVT